MVAGTINITVAWCLLTSINNICQDQLLPPNSPWTCPGRATTFSTTHRSTGA
ncbi:hypothetical protein ACS0TY_025552 [Phlomoides rotata]